MRKDPTEFRKRFQLWKLGMPAYRAGKPIGEDEDTRSDTTREGYNERGVPYGAGRGPAGDSPLRILDIVNEETAAVKNRPGLQIGEPPAVGIRNPGMFSSDFLARAFKSKGVGRAPTFMTEEVRRNTANLKAALGTYDGKGSSLLTKQAKSWIEHNKGKVDLSLFSAEEINKLVKMNRRDLANANRDFVLVDRNPQAGNFEFDVMHNNQSVADMIGGFSGSHLVPEMVESYSKIGGMSRKLYDAAIQSGKQLGYNGLVSGKYLISAPKTWSVWKHYPDKKLIGRNGRHLNRMMTNPDQEGPLVKSMQEAKKAATQNKNFTYDEGPVYLLKKESLFVPVKDKDIFDASILNPDGTFARDWNSKDITRIMLPFAIGGGLWGSKEYRGGKDLNLGKKQNLPIEEARQLAQSLKTEQPLDGTDPLLKWLIPQRAVGKAISIGREIFNNHLRRETLREYREAREAGHGRETARFIATPDNLPYELLNWESKLFDWGFKNGKDLPRFKDGDDLKVTIDRGTRYSPIGGDFIWRMNPINEAKYRLYKNMSPYGYAGFYERAKSAIFDDVAEENQKDDIIVNDPRDDQFATYLGIPKEMRRLNVRKLQPALYHPTLNEDTSIPTYRLPLTKDEIRRFIESQYPFPYGTTIVDPDTGNSKNLGILPFNKNIQVSGVWDVASKALTDAFGSYTEGHGLDKNRGEYFSYYEKYDLNPTSGDNAVNDDILNRLPEWYLKKLKQTGDVGINSGITHPFALYDRIYLNDYYGVNDQDVAPDIGDYYGGYFPEITVYPKHKYKSGKDIYIKPSHRGRFTALKKRTGHSASWFKAHGTPALKKMATFALNSKHWAKR